MDKIDKSTHIKIPNRHCLVTAQLDERKLRGGTIAYIPLFIFKLA
jgi:hypothetical protein